MIVINACIQNVASADVSNSNLSPLPPPPPRPLPFKVICSPGFYRNDTTNTCEACLRGSYQPNTGATTCESCGGNFTTAAENSTSASECYGENPITSHDPLLIYPIHTLYIIVNGKKGFLSCFVFSYEYIVFHL